jgi:hypothetical protein
LLIRSEILRLTGDVDAAEAALAQAVSLYERKENVIAAGRARGMTETT